MVLPEAYSYQASERLDCFILLACRALCWFLRRVFLPPKLGTEAIPASQSNKSRQKPGPVCSCSVYINITIYGNKQ